MFFLGRIIRKLLLSIFEVREWVSSRDKIFLLLVCMVLSLLSWIFIVLDEKIVF